MVVEARRRRLGGRAMLLFGTGLCATLTAVDPAAAGGFYLQEQSVRGWGRANSGEVADRGAASLWWNPAAIGGIEESEATFGAVAVLPRGEVEDVASTIDRPAFAETGVGGLSALRDPVQRGVAPSNAVALRLSDKLAVGVSVTSPFSFTSDYDPSGFQRFAAIRSRLITIDLQPSVAFAPTEWLSVGAGLNLEYSDAWLSNALPNLAPGSPDARLRLTGAGWDLGWSAGLQLRPSQRFSFGLAYKSAIEHKLDGTVSIEGLTGALAPRNVEAETVARFTTPWQLIMGARAGVTETLTLNVQAVRFGWSEFDRITVAAPLNSALEQNYRNSWSLAVGLDHRASERLTLRAGVQADSTPTRDASRSPRVADGDRMNYNVGASFALKKHMSLDAAAALTKVEDVPLNRDDVFYGGTAAETRVETRGRIFDQRVLVFMLGGRLAF